MRIQIPHTHLQLVQVPHESSGAPLGDEGRLVCFLKARDDVVTFGNATIGGPSVAMALPYQVSMQIQVIDDHVVVILSMPFFGRRMGWLDGGVVNGSDIVVFDW